jgi:hypothetical protein
VVGKEQSMDFRIFEEIGAVPNVIRGLKRELIGMQIQYTIEKTNTLRDFCRNGIGTKGTIEQYDKIINELLYSGYRNIHDILTKEEIKLLGPDQYIERNYSEWCKDDNCVAEE